MINEPFFSIICPMFNSASFVERTIRSVIAQTFQDFELILIDDGSDDNTCELIENIIRQYPDHNIRLLQNSHLGPGAARNTGIKAAAAEWIAFLDSDDLWESQKLQVVFDVISKNLSINFISHAEESIKLDGTKVLFNGKTWYDPKKPLPYQLYRRNLFSTSAVISKKALLIEFGMFSEELMSAQDYECWLRLSPNIKVNFIDEKLGCYLERSGNISSGNSWKRWLNVLKILFQHRDKVSWEVYVWQSIKVTLSYLKNNSYKIKRLKYV